MEWPGALRIGVVTGDDLLPRIDELLSAGHELRNMDPGEPLSLVRDRVIAANAYIGSTPIVEALAGGANVVITGRSTDTALTMAPLRHEFGTILGSDHLGIGYGFCHVSPFQLLGRPRAQQRAQGSSGRARC